MKVRALIIVVSAALAAGCGPTVGDPCTTANDCLGRSCIISGALPGGYCSVACTMDNASACPTGSVCVTNAIANGTHGCMRRCNSARDCRATYKCETERGSGETVCTGPNGL